MSNAWDDLPNAALIDWVLQLINDRPWILVSTWTNYDSIDRLVCKHQAFKDTKLNGRTLAYTQCRTDIRLLIHQNHWCYRQGPTERAQLKILAKGIISALIAYDDCDQYLSMTYDELRVWALLSGTPQAVLLLPMKWVQEHESVVASA